MATNVTASQLFDDVMANTMSYVDRVHGEEAMHQLFFELYNQTFSFLDRKFGFEAVEMFWDYIADEQLGTLEELMRKKGFKGMEEYWRNTLDQEGAEYEMRTEDDYFRLVVKRCPPNEWFKCQNIEHYSRYSDHCERLYRRVGERCGFAMEYIPPDEDENTCCGFQFTRESGE